MVIHKKNCANNLCKKTIAVFLLNIPITGETPEVTSVTATAKDFWKFLYSVPLRTTFRVTVSTLCKILNKKNQFLLKYIFLKTKHKFLL